MIPDEKSETYNHVELDELAGSLLLHGSLQGAMSHLLDATSDMADLALIEMTNHAPDGMAATILTATAIAAKETRLRMDALAKACDSALASLVDRMESDKQRVRDAFDDLMKDSWVEEEEATDVDPGSGAQ